MYAKGRFATETSLSLRNMKFNKRYMPIFNIKKHPNSLVIGIVYSMLWWNICVKFGIGFGRLMNDPSRQFNGTRLPRSSVTSHFSDVRDYMFIRSVKRTILSEKTFQEEWGKSSVLTIEGKIRKRSICLHLRDREYFNKVSKGEVLNFLGNS